jgi:WD40 repeat protein
MCDFLVHRTHLYKPRLSSILSLAHHHQNSSSNHLLAVLRSDHSIELWNTHDSFTLERTIQPRHASDSPELVLWLEQYLITGGLDGQLVVYDPITFEIKTSCHAVGGAIWSMAKHEATRRIAVGTETGHVNIYQLDEVNYSNFEIFNKKIYLGGYTIFISYISLSTSCTYCFISMAYYR